MAPFAVIRPVTLSPRQRLALAALICATGLAVPFGQRARAGDCMVGTDPSGAAGTSALYGELSDKVNAEPLSVDITARAINGTCVWVYEVKVLTVSGGVALLDFDLANLGLKRVVGSREDPDIARLYDRLADSAGDNSAGAGSQTDSNASNDSDDGNEGGESGDSGGEGGEGGGEGGGGGSGGGSGGSGGGGEGGGHGGSGGGGEGGGGHGGGEGGHGGGESGH